jgi:hypothetical protein
MAQLDPHARDTASETGSDSGRGPASATRPSLPPSNDTRPPPPRDLGARDDVYRKVSLGALVALLTAALGVHAKWLLQTKSLGEAAHGASQWLSGLTRGDVGGYALVFGPVVVLFAAVVALLVRNGLPDVWRSARQSMLAGLLFGGCLLAIGLLRTANVSSLSDIWWLYFVPVVPPVLLAYQAMVMWRQRPRSFGGFSIGVSHATEQALRNEGCWTRYRRTYKQLLRVFGGTYVPEEDERQEPSAQRSRVGVRRAPVTTASAAYAPAYFATHFAIPALLLGLVGLGAISLAISAPDVPHIAESVQTRLQHGIRWGVAGAFVYVLIEFGGRMFRNDLTVGAAIWGIVTLLVGPALAVLLAIGWNLKPSADAEWQACAVLFFAGLAPRRVVSIVEGVALQLLKAQSAPTTPPKLAPLTNLRGISPELAARLREENIHDVSALAYADPIRLVQSLPYDLRQVVDWVDEALLATVLPKHYEALIDRGVTGAIDLAWRWLAASVAMVDGEWRIAPAAADTPPPSFIKLAGGNAADASSIYESAAQVFYEEQVCLLWVMYNCFSTTAGSMEGDEAGGASAGDPA